MSLQLPTGLPWVSLDTETSGLFKDDGARVACVALTHRDWSIGLPFDQGVRDKMPNPQLGLDLFGDHAEDANLPVEDWQYLLRWLQDQTLVFQNAKFDLHMMRVGTRHWEGVDLLDQFHWDTMLASGILDPLHPRGLDATAIRLGIGAKTGLEALQGWLKNRGFNKYRYDLAPWDLVKVYVTGDTEMTDAIYEHQQARLAGGDIAHEGECSVMDRIERSFNLMRALYRMEQRGIPYDDVQSEESAQVLDRVADAIEREMPFKCTPSGAKDWFLRKLGLTTDRFSTKTGAPTIDEQQVRKWIAEDIPWAKEYADVTKCRRAVSMWYRGYAEKIGVDGRLRTSFKQGDVKSGRMSVERVQLQALPKSDKYSAVGSNERLPIFKDVPDVRKLIYPDEGFGLWNLDLSQAELRVAAHYSQCKNMLEQLANGIDSHGEVTKNVMRVQPDSPEWKAKRDIAKRLNFGGIFMIGGETFQATLAKLADLHLPLEECDDYVRGWRRMYPEFQVAYYKAMRKFESDGYVRLLPNTPYEERSWYNRERDYPRTAWNRMVQGSLAVAFGYWLGEIERRWPGYLILTVHDSVVLEAPLDEGDQLAAEVAAFGASLMTEIFGVMMKVDTDRW